MRKEEMGLRRDEERRDGLKERRGRDRRDEERRDGIKEGKRRWELRREGV
jgi:hypothetical protein